MKRIYHALRGTNCLIEHVAVAQAGIRARGDHPLFLQLPDQIMVIGHLGKQSRPEEIQPAIPT